MEGDEVTSQLSADEINDIFKNHQKEMSKIKSDIITIKNNNQLNTIDSKATRKTDIYKEALFSILHTCNNLANILIINNKSNSNRRFLSSI